MSPLKHPFSNLLGPTCHLPNSLDLLIPLGPRPLHQDDQHNLPQAIPVFALLISHLIHPIVVVVATLTQEYSAVQLESEEHPLPSMHNFRSRRLVTAIHILRIRTP